MLFLRFFIRSTCIFNGDGQHAEGEVCVMRGTHRRYESSSRFKRSCFEERPDLSPHKAIHKSPLPPRILAWFLFGHVLQRRGIEQCPVLVHYNSISLKLQVQDPITASGSKVIPCIHKRFPDRLQGISPKSDKTFVTLK